MSAKKPYPEIKQLNLPAIDAQILQFWETEKIFEQSISNSADKPAWVFYEGPPSANAMPGIHHVMARAIKDIFCRYHTLKGKQVMRKGGWDTHGLPIELEVEKEKGITKKDIGTKITVEEYNAACRERVLKFKDVWDDLTVKMGFWLDLEDPYVTYENNYIESVWYLLKQFYDKGLIYKGYTIQPYSPAAGTGLSTHELNQPGCYKNVKDTSATAQFLIKEHNNASWGKGELFFLAWTTTPWTLPSNTALAVGANIDYVKVKTYNPYTAEKVSVILAEALLPKYFKPEGAEADINSFEVGAKMVLPYRIISKHKGSEFNGWRYEQLIPIALPFENADNAFQVIIGDFVTTEDGTGIVHISPTFGADDMRVAKANNVPPMLVLDENNNPVPLVDLQGKFVDQAGELAGRFVKNYLKQDDYVNVDIDISVALKKRNRAFKVEKYEHSYPHCWRTDMPVLYYPLDSWFIKAESMRERMAKLNEQINWKPASTGTGRFGNWLENANDWNLSRSRFWGTPLPIWVSEDGSEIKCIGSIEEFRNEVAKAVEAGFMEAQLADDFDLHKPYVDRVFLVSDSGKKMTREPDLIDVWFDSGAMPYAQWHYPFENKESFEKNFPADFIAEGVDQTRGWFYTLHAIASMLFDSVAYKNVVSNGLLLDKNGVKMSKRLGNSVDPFETIATYGADATRWYMISNAQPWDNLKFDIEGIKEVQRKFFGTLHNTYSFFALYANIDGFTFEEPEVPINERPEIDRWILSSLNTLIKEADAAYADYEPTKAARMIMEFTDRNLSNWFVRLSRRRFWKGDYSSDKISAYQTLYQCLEVLAQLISPISPFFSDFLYQNLNNTSTNKAEPSVHLTLIPTSNESIIDEGLEQRMKLAQDISSMVLALRKKTNIKVRQPLHKILIPVLDDRVQEQIEAIEPLILSEVNVKEIEYIKDASGIIVKSIKPDFKMLGKKLGPNMKAVASIINTWEQDEIAQIEKDGKIELSVNNETVEILLNEVQILSEDIPGWEVNSANGITVALDINIDDALKAEGDAREFVNKIQRLRKDMNFKVTDKIVIKVAKNNLITKAIESHRSYICNETLTETLVLVDAIDSKATAINVNEELLQVEITNLN